MEVSILQGAFYDTSGNIRPSLPINMQPVLTDSGFSKDYLRTAPGLTLVATGPGQDRGSIVWNGVHYRVMGNQLCSVSGGTVTQLGNVGNDGNPVKLDFGFDRLAIYSAHGLYYWNGTTLTQVTDPNLGTPIDVCWIDGYYMLTDGTNLYVTELNSPTTILPSGSEQPPEDPTPVVAVMRIRDEIYAVTTNSIQNFQNIGGLNFPFQVNPSGMIAKGALGTHAVCYYLNTLAFVGGGRNEAPSVYLAGFGAATQISTPEIDRQLKALTPAQQAAIEIEGMVSGDEQRLYVHLPTVTLVYHNMASQAAQKPIWTQLAGGVAMNQAYPARHFASVGGTFYGGSATGQIGSHDGTVETQFGQATTWQFDAGLIYNEGKGAIVKSVELAGAVNAGTALLSWTRDGKNWGPQQAVTMDVGNPSKHVQWRPKTRMWSVLGLRFQGQGAVTAGFGRLDVDLEPLNG